MNTAFYIAKRYLFSKKSVNAINIISIISLIGVLVSSAALIIILSIFNGLETLVLSMYSSFTPDIRIEAVKGKYFVPDSAFLKYLKENKKIVSYSGILQEKVLLRYGNNQVIGTIKGVSDGFKPGPDVDSLMYDGDFLLYKHQKDAAVIGAQIQMQLGVNLGDTLSIDVYSPRKGVQNAINPADEFNIRSILPTGVLKSQQQLDPLIITPLTFARDVLGEYDQLSAIEIISKHPAQAAALQHDLSNFLKGRFIVKNRVQQNALLYKILNSEKWAVFFILTFVLIIATFNIIGSLTMLVIDKSKDITVLRSLGAANVLVRRIFFLEGMMISLIGCILGMLLGCSVCLLQQYFGFIKMGDNNFIDAYPVEIQWEDFTTVFFTVTIISGIVSILASRLSLRGSERLH
ncbi:lipoprotein-releasing system permease protein [bacterium A37T11]|nr:lipoprotein-releasing system permease protein [bacterium A37T11]